MPTNRLPVRALLAPGAIALGLIPIEAASAQDLVVPAGATIEFDSTAGLKVDSVHIEAGATVRVVGAEPLRIVASGRIQIDGTLDLSGFDGPDVLQFASPNLPSPGGAGVAGSGAGGAGSPETTTSSPAGGRGYALLETSPRGGAGGETGFGADTNYATRRGAGGGGGRFAQDAPSQGLVATAGEPGTLGAAGAVTNLSPPQGGAAGPAVMTGSPDDDFFGVGVDPVSLQPIFGELQWPRAGVGGGGGGDSIKTATFPALGFQLSNHRRGAGGGAGGGLGLVVARTFALGPLGRVVADGGDGGVGEANPQQFEGQVGGCGGGGSGGMLIVQAQRFDLTEASSDALSAVGGAPGAGAVDGVSGGGHGGPGVIQLHLDGDATTDLLLPAGATLADLSVPDAFLLEPFSGL